MTKERAHLFGVAPTAPVERLLADIHSAAERARKALPGDREDISRLDALATQLEHHAVSNGQMATEVAVDDATDAFLFGVDEARWRGTPPLLARSARDIVAAGLVPVLVVQSLVPGDRDGPAPTAESRPVAERWSAGGLTGRRAVEARFRSQIEGALDADGCRSAAVIAPDGVPNVVLTEGLREFVHARDASAAVLVPVEYRDGSRTSRPFPLRSLKLQSSLAPADLELRFALLSIRHAEMDAVVDGAWLRNAEVSRPRRAAETDELVYEISRAQLDALTLAGTRRVRLDLYQTGLEPAVVGFYRALIDHLVDSPESAAVQPMYFAPASSGPARRSGEGNRRRSGGSRDRGRSSGAALVATHARFRKGTPWQI